jgi:hypothetical protein
MIENLIIDKSRTMTNKDAQCRRRPLAGNDFDLGLLKRGLAVFMITFFMITLVAIPISIPITIPAPFSPVVCRLKSGPGQFSGKPACQQALPRRETSSFSQGAPRPQGRGQGAIIKMPQFASQRHAMS